MMIDPPPKLIAALITPQEKHDVAISAFGTSFRWPDVKVPMEADPVLVARTVATSALSIQTPRAHGPISETTMPTAKLNALTILGGLDEARSELFGKAVVLTDGKAGTVENIWLDEFHGLRISIRGHDGKWPISTIKFTQPG